MADENVSIALRLRGERAVQKGLHDTARAEEKVGDSARHVERETTRAGRAFTRFNANARVARGASVGMGIGMRTGAGAALALTGGIYGLARGVRVSVDAWQEKRKIIAQTSAVLKSTGGQANVTERDIDRLSTTLSRRTGMDDEAIRGAQNLLLTFRDVHNEAGRGNDVFTQSTKATLDLSAAMGMGLNQAALQVGKALNDPERGFKRLQRIGVSFSKTQEKQIKHFSAVGDRAGAQRVILAELNKEFGGSAAKQVTALDRLHTSWGNIEEAVGQGVSPAIDAAAAGLDKMLVKAEPQLQRFNKALEGIWGRKDLSFDQKMQLSERAAKRILGPFLRQLGHEIERADLGDKLAHAFELAAPKLADAAARSAPRAASAFVHAFLHASPWGQLVMTAALAHKAGLFGKAFGAAAGRSGARHTAENVVHNLPGGLESRKGRLKAPLGTFGRALGVMMAVEMAPELIKEIEKALKALGWKPPKDAGIHGPLDFAKHVIDSSTNLLPDTSDRGPLGKLLFPKDKPAARGKRGGGQLPAGVGANRSDRGSVYELHNHIYIDGKQVHGAVVRHEQRRQDHG